MEDVGAPTKVVFLRNLPVGVDEHDLLSFGIPFGNVTRVLTLHGKTIGFMEYETAEEAAALVTHCQQYPAKIRGQRCYVKFSDKSELTSGIAPASLAPAGGHMGPGTSYPPYGMGPAYGGGGSGAPLIVPASLPPGTAEDAGGRRVVLVTLDNLSQAISMDDVYTLFNVYGPVQKISSFVKNGKNQVLVQFAGQRGAEAALQNLNGQHVGVCTLLVQWSTLPELNFQRNDESNRDYTTISTLSPVVNLVSGGAAVPPPMPPGIHLPAPTPTGAAGPIRTGPRMPIVVSPVGVPIFGTVTPSGITGSVLFVRGLDEERVTAGALFTLFGLYGEVQMARILFKKRDSALVQFADAQQAQQARLMLQGLPLYGKPLAISTSKNMAITPGSAEDPNLTASQATHRRSSYSAKNVMPPSSTLHLSNLLPEVTEDHLVALFGQYATVVAFEYFKTTNKMAKIQLDSIPSAVTALLALNHYTLQLEGGKACTLHLAFSKHPIRPVPAQ